MSDEVSLSTVEIVELTSNTVHDLKDFVKNSDLNEEEFEKLLNAEKNNKNRKTAKKFLRRKENSLEKHEDLEKAEKEVADLEKILDKIDSVDSDREKVDLSASEVIEILSGSTESIKNTVKEKKLAKENLKELLESEKKFKDRDSVKNALKREKNLVKEAEIVKQAEEDVKDLEEKISELEDSETDATSQGERSTEEDEKKEGDIDESEEENPDEEDSENRDSEELEEEDETEDDKENETEEDEDDAEEEPEQDAQETDLKELIEEEPEKVMDKLDKMSMDDIEKLAFEEKLRDALIADLEDDFDKEKLEKVSTRDLIKLRAETESKSSSQEENDKEESDKDKEEMQEEAEEDLEMLMGARSVEDTGDEEDGLSKIENLKGSLKEKFSRESEEADDEEDEGISESDVMSLLEDYENLPRKEAVVKTAHIMKGYLEYRKDVERELTYGELAGRLEDSDIEEVRDISDYFEKMRKDEYTGNVDIDREEIIEKSKNAVKKTLIDDTREIQEGEKFQQVKKSPVHINI